MDIDWEKLTEIQLLMKHISLVVGEEKTLSDLEKKAFNEGLERALAAIKRVVGFSVIAGHRFGQFKHQ